MSTGPSDEAARTLEPVRLHPPPERAGACPRDGSAITVERLHLPGARFLLEGRCPACGHRYVQDLPSGHATVYPSTLDLDTREAHGQWFETELRESHGAPDRAPVRLTIDRRGDVERAIVLNALEPVYGHALLRLLNAQRLEADAERAGEGLVVLVSAALAALVPSGVAEAWIVDEPLGRLRGWLTELDQRLHAELSRFSTARLARAVPHPHPATFSLEHFTGPLRPERLGEPSVVLCLREERLWGRSARDQRKRFGRLCGRLAESLPDARFAAIGVVGPGAAPEGAIDLTSPRPTAELEARWLGVLAGADLAIGVHGSNMLMPSGLARATVELLPEGRFDNLAQATLATDPDPLASLFRHRTVYGSSDLRDVAPDRVAAIALATLMGGPHFRARQLGPPAGQTNVPMRPAEPSFGDPPASRWQPAPGE